jgi:hypothetical protein
VPFHPTAFVNKVKTFTPGAILSIGWSSHGGCVAGTEWQCSPRHVATRIWNARFISKMAYHDVANTIRQSLLRGLVQRGHHAAGLHRVVPGKATVTTDCLIMLYLYILVHVLPLLLRLPLLCRSPVWSRYQPRPGIDTALYRLTVCSWCTCRDVHRPPRTRP